ncbi:GntR family transcriptional regulator [Pseudoclavibacter endophyticus]|uniref:GntR family transcriptional regulator n=1 Tax=Pseudoclavibacter endophyticus TaxID=1778590 RepID=A0A6H9WNA9_9MICO|nr:GntR family transcriptional regulator [Pseudoclavibacter endophyticus]KAB1649191.1 GntR family transcriptional regulator [Pseudoclavibacter endophyticus]
MSTPRAATITLDSTSLARVSAPLREQVIDVLTQAIIENRLRAGQRLVERELVESLGVSRTTVREALRELATQGLVDVVPQRGAVVASPTYDEARDLYEVRASLESLIVARFVEKADDEQVARLEAAVETFAASVDAGDGVVGVLASKDEFYEVLLEGAGSSVFKELVARLQLRVHVLRARSLSAAGRSHATVGELRAIVGAVRRRDAASAANLTSAHIRAAAHTALDHLKPKTSAPLTVAR